MSRLRINFAPRRTQLSPWVAIGAFVLLGWAIVLFFRYQALLQDSLQTRDHISHLNAATQAARDSAAQIPEPVVAPERAIAINAAISVLNVPWTDLLTALEQARPPSVALLQIEPNATRATLRIVAEGDTAGDLLGYADALTQRPPFRHYTPIRQEEVMAGGRTRLQLAFDLEWGS